MTNEIYVQAKKIYGHGNMKLKTCVPILYRSPVFLTRSSSLFDWYILFFCISLLFSIKVLRFIAMNTLGVILSNKLSNSMHVSNRYCVSNDTIVWCVKCNIFTIYIKYTIIFPRKKCIVLHFNKKESPSVVLVVPKLLKLAPWFWKRINKCVTFTNGQWTIGDQKS